MKIKNYFDVCDYEENERNDVGNVFCVKKFGCKDILIVLRFFLFLIIIEGLSFINK